MWVHINLNEYTNKKKRPKKKKKKKKNKKKKKKKKKKNVNCRRTAPRFVGQSINRMPSASEPRLPHGRRSARRWLDASCRHPRLQGEGRQGGPQPTPSERVQHMTARPPTRRFARRGSYCGAWARSRARPCRAWPMKGGVRCRLHGGFGISGPKTVEGKARISAGVSAAWARWREECSLPADWRNRDNQVCKRKRESARDYIAKHGRTEGGAS